MKDYNTITAELLKNAPNGIDCYVSNVSYEDALRDIHCTGDAVTRIFHCSNGAGGVRFTDTKFDFAYVIPVHLVVKELFDGCISLLERQHCEDATELDKGLCDFLLHID